MPAIVIPMNAQSEIKLATLVFLRKMVSDVTYICLAEKKRGFAEGKWNGVGGKLEEHETIEQAAVREAKEEILVDINTDDLQKVAEIKFTFDNRPGWNQHVHVFLVDQWQGEPQESEEMSPDWFNFQEIPFDLMWEDDRYWLPRILGGEKLNAHFHFDSDEKIISKNIVPIFS